MNPSANFLPRLVPGISARCRVDSAACILRFLFLVCIGFAEFKPLRTTKCSMDPLDLLQCLALNTRSHSEHNCHFPQPLFRCAWRYRVDYCVRPQFAKRTWRYPTAAFPPELSVCMSARPQNRIPTHRGLILQTVTCSAESGKCAD
jgi:hypothetical protein